MTDGSSEGQIRASGIQERAVKDTSAVDGRIVVLKEDLLNRRLLDLFKKALVQA